MYRVRTALFKYSFFTFFKRTDRSFPFFTKAGIPQNAESTRNDKLYFGFLSCIQTKKLTVKIQLLFSFLMLCLL